MGCVDVNDTVHMVQLRLSQSHLCVWHCTWMCSIPILCDCNVLFIQKIWIAVTPWQQFYKITLKKSQSHSHNIAPRERVLNNAMQLISNCNQIVHPKNRVLHFCSNCIFRDLWKDCFVEYISKLHCDKEDKDVFHHEEHVFPHVSSSDIKHVCVKISAINAWRSRSLHTHAFLTPVIKLREIIYFFYGYMKEYFYSYMPVATSGTFLSSAIA